MQRPYFEEKSELLWWQWPLKGPFCSMNNRYYNLELILVDSNIFSNDCTWHRHLELVKSKAWKRTNIHLRKPRVLSPLRSLRTGNEEDFVPLACEDDQYNNAYIFQLDTRIYFNLIGNHFRLFTSLLYT